VSWGEKSSVLLSPVTARWAAEQWLGLWLAGGILVLGVAMLATLSIVARAPRFAWSPSAGARRRFETVVAAVMAYGIYVAAALQADAEFPRFLRDHLFDGLAPAALVGLLVSRFPRDNPRTAFPGIRLPFLIDVLFAVSGAMIFGLIGAAAVFASGSSDFWPVALCAAFGGIIFPYGYGQLIYFEGDIEGWWPRLKWWFKKRSNDTASPDTEVATDTASPDTDVAINEDDAFTSTPEGVNIPAPETRPESARPIFPSR